MAEKENVGKGLKTAFNTEITGYMFYTYAAEIVGDEKGRNVFAHLAKEELDHIRVISRIAESVEEGHGWVGYEEALKEVAAGTGGLPVFPKENDLTKRLKQNPTDANAVKIGVESEEASVELYSMMLKGAQRPQERVVLTKLLEMEKAHLKILRWEAESLQKTGFWCGDMEYSVEKEIDG